ncbi:hypothetical protein T484DRAFT_1904186 [Baffinella frigidus]|nr:hypothetical protein T484DRAFT_1904186 [Cryptophyta sp. CCMP2293]|mmetsp:Transcript_64961/g.153906  ORF Transcript_64961/g.153906 Transcript_64961/m.153906 type:complete len:146 (+) Transcript_64961:82-519(+)
MCIPRHIEAIVSGGDGQWRAESASACLLLSIPAGLSLAVNPPSPKRPIVPLRTPLRPSRPMFDSKEAPTCAYVDQRVTFSSTTDGQPRERLRRSPSPHPVAHEETVSVAAFHLPLGPRAALLRVVSEEAGVHPDVALDRYTMLLQ